MTTSKAKLQAVADAIAHLDGYAVVPWTDRSDMARVYATDGPLLTNVVLNILDRNGWLRFVRADADGRVFAAVEL